MPSHAQGPSTLARAEAPRSHLLRGVLPDRQGARERLCRVLIVESGEVGEGLSSARRRGRCAHGGGGRDARPWGTSACAYVHGAGGASVSGVCACAIAGKKVLGPRMEILHNIFCSPLARDGLPRSGDATPVGGLAAVGGIRCVTLGPGRGGARARRRMQDSPRPARARKRGIPPGTGPGRRGLCTRSRRSALLGDMPGLPSRRDQPRGDGPRPPPAGRQCFLLIRT
jgi:hypothetical protein